MFNSSNTLVVNVRAHCAIFLVLISQLGLGLSGGSVLSCRCQGDPLLFIWTQWLHLVRCDWSGTSGEKAPDKWAWLDSANQLSTLVFMRQVEWAGSLPSYLPIM